MVRRQADDRSLDGLQSGDSLPPWLGTGIVKQDEALALQLVRGGLHGVRVGDLELDARLRLPKDVQPSMPSLCR